MPCMAGQRGSSPVATRVNPTAKAAVTSASSARAERLRERERILAEARADRERFAAPSGTPPATSRSMLGAAGAELGGIAEEARAQAQRVSIRVRLPSGEVIEEYFAAWDGLASVFDRVDNHLHPGNADALDSYSLLQAFPKRVFIREVLGNRSLSQLELVPSAMLSVLRAEDRGRVESGSVEAALHTGDIEGLSYEELLELEHRMGDGESDGKRAKKNRLDRLYMKRTKVHTFTAKAANEAVGRSDDNRCSICLEDYREATQIRTLWCGHDFHQACVDQWFTVREECPVCREPLAE